MSGGGEQIKGRVAKFKALFKIGRKSFVYQVLSPYSIANTVTTSVQSRLDPSDLYSSTQ